MESISITGIITFYEYDIKSKFLNYLGRVKNRILNNALRELPKLCVADAEEKTVGKPITHCIIGKGGDGTHFLDNGLDDERINLYDEILQPYGISSVKDPNWKTVQDGMSSIYLAVFNSDNLLYENYPDININEIGLIIGGRLAQQTPGRLFSGKDFGGNPPIPNIITKSMVKIVIEYEVRFRRMELPIL